MVAQLLPPSRPIIYMMGDEERANSCGPRLYSLDSSWAPEGAETDTPPGSAERRLLDDLVNDYNVPPEMLDYGYQTGRGIWNIDELNNNVFRFAEAMEFIEQNGPEKFRDVIKRAGIVDPTDPEDIPPEVRARIEEIAARVDARVGSDPRYCDAFAAEFYGEGLGPLEAGGLCFGRPLDEEEFPAGKETAGDGFRACMTGSPVKGVCDTTGYKIVAAHRYLGRCEPPYVVISNPAGDEAKHLFAEHNGMPLDPAGFGRTPVREHRPLTWRQAVAAFIVNSIRKEQNGGERQIDMMSASARAVLMDPDSPEAHVTRGDVLDGNGDYDGAACEYEQALALRPGFTEAVLALLSTGSPPSF